jgi:hypothetical protein
MDVKDATVRTALLWGVCLTSFLFGACNQSFSDPFIAPPIGQKFYIPAYPDGQTTMSLNSESVKTRATLIKLSDSSEIGNSRRVHSSIGAKAPIGFKSITLLGKYDSKEVYDQVRIKKLNDTDECRAIAIDMKELLMSYPGMTLVCGLDFTNDFRAALSVTAVTEDGKEHSFTSWASHFSDGAGYRIVIQSLSL